MVAAGEEPQALRRLVEQLGLRQDAAADRDHGVGGEDEGAFSSSSSAHASRAPLPPCSRASRVGAGARQFAALRRLVDVGRTQRVGLDADLVDKREPARRAGGENEFGPADHGYTLAARRGAAGAPRARLDDVENSAADIT